MTRAGQNTPLRPTNLPRDEWELRYDLIKEELEEYQGAAFTGDLVGVADAIGDMLYVVLGTAIAHGLDIVPIFEEIHRSNMSKFGDHSFRDDGKLIKGPNYTPANLLPILEEQSK